MSNFVTTEQVLQRVADIMEQRMEKRVKELEYAQNRIEIEPVRKWLLMEFSFPEGASRGDFPKGVVDVDTRRSERREQDTGETAEIDVVLTIYFSREGLSASDAKRRAVRYGDAMLYTLMREAKGKRPSDATALPGWFRIWPVDMTPGLVRRSDLMGAQVRARVTIDSQDSYAA